ncbi:hypothetical protein [Actinoplanes sp. L3-i22]|uniref:hypothetical protein n=1 Tax=Actinoplanes sp. L3-i22 TaxID=2836373 RepID=UPI001C8527D3|nr:hypothetical protein [Actinoplanes sp. L3-i22]
MRRFILAVTTGALLLTGTACGSTSEDATDAAAPAATVAASPSADFTADTKKVCDSVGTLLGGKKMEDFGVELGKTIAYKQAKQTANATKARTDAGKRLKAVGAALNASTAKAQDPDLKAAGTESLKRIDASASDDAFFAKFKTLKDIDSVLEAEMTGWLEPMDKFCS